MMHVKLAASNLLTIIASVPLNLASESWGFIELMIMLYELIWAYLPISVCLIHVYVGQNLI